MKSHTVPIRFTLNGHRKSLDVPAGMTALELIREVLKLKGTKEGCGIGECGACTIQVDDMAVNACLMLAAQLDGRTVLTVEGLSSEDRLHPLQQSFLKQHGVQCGFCTPGLLMSTNALVSGNSNPGREDISNAIAGNVCRCTGYHQIFESIDDFLENSGKGRRK